MGAKIKVYAGVISAGFKQHRMIVAATSSHAAIEAIAASTGRRVSMSTFSNYWTRTSDQLEQRIALSKPGAVFQSSHKDRYDLHEVTASGAP